MDSPWQARDKKRLFGCEKGRLLRHLGILIRAFSDILCLALVFYFILGIFKPAYLLSPTHTTGGDMGSHMYSAKFMAEELLPNLRLSGWTMDWYAGLPLFEFYFPLPFAAIALLSYATEFNIAFKLITASGVFLLPFATYASMRLMGFGYPMPQIAAAFSLVMLFNEEYNMWGGNVKSNMAGMFTFTIGVGVTILFLGLIYAYALRGKHYAKACLALALIPLCHIYTLIWGVLSSAFLLMPWGGGDGLKRFNRTFSVHIMGFCLSAFWTIRLLSKFGWSTPFGAWRTQSIWEVVPSILLPFYFLAAAQILIFALRPRANRAYLIFITAVPLTLFTLIHKGVTEHLLDVRFMPFAYLGVLLMSADSVSVALRRVRGTPIAALIVVIMAIMWVNNNQSIISEAQTFMDGESAGLGESAVNVYSRAIKFQYEGDVPAWVRWNYEGYERKSGWPAFEQLFGFLDTLPKGRVVHEFSSTHSASGTPRTLELIPFFTKHPVLEGLNIESGVASPFHFYMQSEYSESATCPLSYMRCARFDLQAANRHFRYFAPAYLVATSQKLKDAVENDGGYTHLESFRLGMAVYAIDYPAPLVEVFDFMPALVRTDSWWDDSMKWWRDADAIDVPIVLAASGQRISGPFIDFDRGLEFDPKRLPRVPVDAECEIEYGMSHERIDVKTSCPGMPHLIKVAYNPGWHVIGAQDIYLAGPAFMMVVPDSSSFTLYYARTWVESFALLLSWAAAIAIFAIAMVRVIGIENAGGNKDRPVILEKAEKSILSAEYQIINILSKARRHYKILFPALMALFVLAYAGLEVRQSMISCESFCLHEGFEGGSAGFPYFRSSKDHYDMGWANMKENEGRRLQCSASCDRSRTDFIYVAHGKAGFDMRTLPGAPHRLTLRVDDNYWCRSMDIYFNEMFIDTLGVEKDNVGWKTVSYIIPAEFVDSDISRVRFEHDLAGCLGYDVSDVWLEPLKCNCI